MSPRGLSPVWTLSSNAKSEKLYTYTRSLSTTTILSLRSLVARTFCRKLSSPIGLWRWSSYRKTLLGG